MIEDYEMSLIHSFNENVKLYSYLSGCVIKSLKQDMGYLRTSAEVICVWISHAVNSGLQMAFEIPDLFPVKTIDISLLEFAFIRVILFLLFAINIERLLNRNLYKDFRIVHGLSKHLKWQKEMASDEMEEIKSRLDRNLSNRIPDLVKNIEDIYKQLYNKQDVINHMSVQMDIFCPTVMTQEAKLRRLNAAFEGEESERIKEIRIVGRHVDVKLMEINARMEDLSLYIKRELGIDSDI